MAPFIIESYFILEDTVVVVSKKWIPSNVMKDA